MVIAKTSKAASRLSTQFRGRNVRKVYSAICLGKPANPMGVLAQNLVRDGNISRLATEDEKGASCLLAYTLQELGVIGERSVSKLLIELVTGFKHQIRAQMASIGHPLYGDTLYGAPNCDPGEAAIGLYASHLSVEHPISGEPLVFNVIPTDDWPWSDLEIRYRDLS
jgi:23S rRNA pseudouridine1911/1915/1917 synthase